MVKFRDYSEKEQVLSGENSHTGVTGDPRNVNVANGTGTGHSVVLSGTEGPEG